MFSNANPNLYVHGGWMEIVKSIKPCKKCSLHVTHAPNPYIFLLWMLIFDVP
jgi:hypothetical protein